MKRNLGRLAQTPHEQEKRDHGSCLNVAFITCPAQEIDGLAAYACGLP